MAQQGQQHTLSHTVGPDEGGITVGELALRLAGELGRRCVARGGAWLNGRRATSPEAALAPDATLTLRLPPGGEYQELELDEAAIAYEDRWLIALHKPAGCYVGPTPWDVEGNLLAALGRYLRQREGSAPTLHLAHQLDRDTSGVLLCSRDPAANSRLLNAFSGGHTLKRYRCLCAGEPSWEQIELTTGHGRSAGGRWRLYEAAEVGRELPAGGGRVKLARSSFRLERRLAGAALLEAQLHTGRTHQIRLHLAQLGHPLLGDQRYGGPAAYGGLTLEGHMLHAAELHLSHPITGEPLTLTSPLPRRFQTLLEGAC